MKFVRFEAAGRYCTGVIQNESVVDATALFEQITVDEKALQVRGIEPATGGPLRWAQASASAREQFALRLGDHLASAKTVLFPLSEVRLLAPIARPGKIVGVGRNYADHAKETGVDPFEKPRIIFKMPSSVTAPDATVEKPAGIQKFDFEGELAVVIGAFARHVMPEDALSFVAGYTLLNDLSAREFQFDISPPQTTFAKSMDGFCPLGPVLVTANDIPDPQALQLKTLVNGHVMQEATTADMLFPVANLISYVSQYMTLEPGDVLTTGTPAGIGAFRKPPVWLAAGDRIEVSINSIGTLVTKIA
jgi:2-keto-4-pentenoate hydratase/2-oxohepta-3-ene-1,7-dioic acid hydratase in catechol pathway